MKTAHKRATVYLDQHLHRALRLRAVETERFVSDIINEAVRESLEQDAEDLAAFEERGHEPRLRLEDVLKETKKRGQR